MTVTLGEAAVPDLRKARRARRTAELEWFDVAYRVYLIAFFGIGLVVWLSGLISDEPLAAASVNDLRDSFPAVGGLLAAFAVFLGLRSGSRGGPIAIEEAEVRHLLLAPISHATVLRRPTVQRARSVVAATAVTGAVAGQLAGLRLPGTSEGWVASVAAAGAVVGGLYVVAAVLGHGLGLSERAATAVGAALIGIQALAVADTLPVGPFDTVGSLALWGLRVRVVDLVAPIVVVVAFVMGLRLLDRFSLELISRRSALVAQLRFAVTLQDVRTVMLLRRQLSLEQNRQEPWFTLPKGQRTGKGRAAWRRSVRSLARFPTRRLGRMAMFSVVAGAAEVMAFRGTTPMIVVSGGACFLLGLESLEPLAQELDHPDLTESFPVEPGRLHQRLLIAPGILIAVLAIPGALTAWLMERSTGALGVAAILAIPVALVGGCGAVLNTISGAPDPTQAETEGAFLPPEVAGIHLMFRLIRPPLVAALGSASILLVREGLDRGNDPFAMAVRGGAGCLVLVAFVVWWVERRVAFRQWWRKVMDEGKAGKRTTGATS